MAEKCKCDLCLWNQGSGGGGGGGSTTLAGLTDVDITNPTDGQTLVYNATSGKWENGAGGGDIFETLGTISAATVPMTYDVEGEFWYGNINTDIPVPTVSFAVRNLTVTIEGTPYSVDPFDPLNNWATIVLGENASVDLMMHADEGSLIFSVEAYGSAAEPVITNLTAEVYAPVPDLAALLGGDK